MPSQPNLPLTADMDETPMTVVTSPGASMEPTFVDEEEEPASKYSSFDLDDTMRKMALEQAHPTGLPQLPDFDTPAGFFFSHVEESEPTWVAYPRGSNIAPETVAREDDPNASAQPSFHLAVLPLADELHDAITAAIRDLIGTFRELDQWDDPQAYDLRDCLATIVSDSNQLLGIVNKVEDLVDACLDGYGGTSLYESYIHTNLVAKTVLEHPLLLAALRHRRFEMATAYHNADSVHTTPVYDEDLEFVTRTQLQFLVHSTFVLVGAAAEREESE